MLPDNSMLQPLRREPDATLAHPLGEGPGVRALDEVSKSTARPDDDLLTGLPGERLVREGLADYQAGRRTVAACLIDIGRPRLAATGLIPAGMAPRIAEPESELYRLLREQGGDAYSRYNALMREFVSFESALDLRRRLNLT